MTQLPWWHPESLVRRRPHLDARHRVLRGIREYFEGEGFVEVDTPALQVSPGLEPHLQAFSTTLDEPGEGMRPRYLHTSPEFAMKKLLVAGVPLLFQLTHCYRNADRSATHHPEFTMLEWYRADADYRRLMEDCTALLRAALTAAGNANFTWRGAICDPNAAWDHVTVADAFARHCGIDVLATAPDPQSPSLALLADAAAPLGIAPHAGDEWEDLFFRIFLDRIEPRLGIGAPTILYDYPISMAALSRAKLGDPQVAERFELYVCGLELANGFGELIDAEEQRRRFLEDQAKKQSLYGTIYPIDDGFLAALAFGMPECAGIALGVDRLVMLASGAERIDDVLWAPVE
jgi:lysyl-tRNA synthetase class 2